MSMNKYAIYHISDVPYAYGKDIGTLKVRLRTACGDIKSCKVHYKDRYDWENPFCKEEMFIAEKTQLFDFYEADISICKSRYRYFFELTDMNGDTIYYNERGFHKDMPKEDGAFQFAYLCSADLYKSVKWAQEGIVYQIFPERFCNGNKGNDPAGTYPWGEDIKDGRMFGGDIRGIIDKIPYLKDLGVTILYLTPIFLSGTDHKYNTCDYYKIDPQFGDINEAKELVQICHENNIKVLLDAVFNHSGSDFFAFKDLMQNGEKSKYKDWYFIESYPIDTKKVNYRTFADGVYNMPKLNTANPEVKEYLLKAAEYWVKEVHIDGWRLDVCDEVDHEFWREFRKTVKRADPDAFIVGEVMHEASSFLRGDQFDSIMNYPFKNAMVDFFAKGIMTSEEFYNEVITNSTLYMREINLNMFNLIGSHDTARFITECKGSVPKMKLAIAFQYTFTGIPYILYGDEAGIDGDQHTCRKCMIWDESMQNRELYDYYKKMNSLRKSEKVLVYGKFIRLYSENRILAYKRVYNNKEIYIVLNNNGKEVQISMDIKGTFKELITDKIMKLNDVVSLKPYEALILA